MTDVSHASATLTQRVQQLERVVEVLHVNLAAVRRTIATLLREQA
jgi:hypothetical protein